MQVNNIIDSKNYLNNKIFNAVELEFDLNASSNEIYNEYKSLFMRFSHYEHILVKLKGDDCFIHVGFLKDVFQQHLMYSNIELYWIRFVTDMVKSIHNHVELYSKNNLNINEYSIDTVKIYFIKPLVESFDIGKCQNHILYYEWDDLRIRPGYDVEPYV